jgi:hypothetical protein
MELKKISLVLGIILAAAAIMGAIIKYDQSIAKAEDLKPIQQSIQQMNRRLDLSDLEQMNRDIQRRMWLLEDKHGYAAAQQIYEYKCLKRDFKANEIKIEALKQKKTQ